MIKRLLILYTFCSSLFIKAQYTSVINSNTPGLSESPYSVGSGVYQLESTFFYKNVPYSKIFNETQAYGTNLLFRSSFFLERLEFNLNTTISNHKIGFKNVFISSYNSTNFTRLTLGAKYMLYAPKYDDKSKEMRSWRTRYSFDWKRLIPHVGIYAGGNFGSFLDDFYSKGGISPRVGILLQNEFSDQLNIISNFYYNNIGTNFPEYYYVFTGTYNFSNHWSGFAELEGILEKYQNKFSIGTGLAYLHNENLQFNASVRRNFEGSGFGFTSAFGVSFRLDNHRDKYTELDEFGQKLQKDKPIKYNSGFFTKIFDSLSKLFKKKNKREQKVNLDISRNNASIEVRKEKPRRQRQESLISEISKEDEKQKKKTAKEEKKASKKEEKELKKEAKKKEKEAKRKLKEQLKLEKDLKKVEEELKKEEKENKKPDQ